MLNFHLSSKLFRDIDVDLELAPPGAPGTCRRPDVVVVSRSASDRVDREGAVYRASDVILAVEIVSPGSQRMDRVLKRAEYADAGIPHYWIVDLDEPVSLIACHLAGEFGYVDGYQGRQARRLSRYPSVTTRGSV